MGKGSLILASSSPRRRDMLTYYGYSFLIMPPCTEEGKAAINAEDPEDYASQVSLEKGASIIDKITAKKLTPGESRLILEMSELWVLSADTIVVKDNKILGKPVDREDALRMLSLLSGSIHLVITAWHLLYGGVGVLPKDVKEFRYNGMLLRGYSGISRTQVGFRALRKDEIERYVATGEPMDKAGAYAAQGYAAYFINCIEGPYSNVIGLPIEDIVPFFEKVIG